jgi:hypothetical protein
MLARFGAPAARPPSAGQARAPVGEDLTPPLRVRHTGINVHRLAVEINANVLARLAEQISGPGCVLKSGLSLKIRDAPHDAVANDTPPAQSRYDVISDDVSHNVTPRTALGDARAGNGDLALSVPKSDRRPAPRLHRLSHRHRIVRSAGVVQHLVEFAHVEGLPADGAHGEVIGFGFHGSTRSSLDPLGFVAIQMGTEFPGCHLSARHGGRKQKRSQRFQPAGTTRIRKPGVGSGPCSTG